MPSSSSSRSRAPNQWAQRGLRHEAEFGLSRRAKCAHDSPIELMGESDNCALISPRTSPRPIFGIVSTAAPGTSELQYITCFLFLLFHGVGELKLSRLRGGCRSVVLEPKAGSVLIGVLITASPHHRAAEITKHHPAPRKKKGRPRRRRLSKGIGHA